jgi:hypothetical protein
MFFLHLNNTRSFILDIIQGAQCFSRRFLNDYYSDHTYLQKISLINVLVPFVCIIGALYIFL